ncbi:MAG TPA: hypothetical protein PK765_05680 [bacterium]|nr:hypothetical protein [bacterium]
MRRRASARPSGNNVLTYLVPIGLAFVVVFLIVHSLLSGRSDSSSDVTNAAYALVSPVDSGSRVFVYMSGDSRKEIESPTKFFTTDSRLEIESGRASFVPAGTSDRVMLDTNAEASYLGLVNGTQRMAVKNGNAWIETVSGPLEIQLDAYILRAESGSVVAISQNTRASNAYVLRGSAVASSADGIITGSVGVGQQLTVVLNELSSVTSFNALVEPIDDFFRSSEWFFVNSGQSYLQSSTASGQTGTGSDSGTGMISSASKYVVFTHPKDEMTLDDPSLDISGIVTSDRVKRISINEQEASLNTETREFALPGYRLSAGANDLVYKTFDDQDKIISKGVMTVYSGEGSVADKPSEKPSVQTFPLSDSDFPIVSPTENPYTTTGSLVRIDGRVKPGVVEYITINDYRLQKFVPQGSTWYYFANSDYDTLAEGLNLYTIRFYGANNQLLKERVFTIVKKPSVSAEDVIKPIESSTSSTGTEASDTSDTSVSG